MSSNILKSFIFWRKFSKDFSSAPSLSPSGKKLSLPLDFNEQSTEHGMIPRYVQLDPEVGHNGKELKATPTSPTKSNFYESLIQDAPLLPGEFESKDGLPLPSWLDKDQLTLGLNLVTSNLYSILLAHLLSLFIIVTIRPLQALLLRTTPFHNVQEEDGGPSPSLLFTLKTILKLRNIYAELRLWSTSGESEFPEMTQLREWFKSGSGNFKKFLPPLSTELSLSGSEALGFIKFRQGVERANHHSQTGRVELSTVEKIRTTLNPVVPLSQYDLAILQFSFSALPTLFPKLFGLDSGKDLQGLSHLWALIGHSLGLRDEFNFALLQSTQPELKWRPISKEVVEKILQFSFAQVDSMGFKLWILLGNNLKREGFRWIYPALNLTSVIHILSRSVLDIPLLDTGLGFRRTVNSCVQSLMVQITRCWAGRMVLNCFLRGILSFLTWFYIGRRTGERSGSSNDLSTSRMSLTRSIRWSSKEDGIAFQIV